MNYIGSKLSLLPFLENVYHQVADGNEKVFCDIFAGTGAVGRHFKRLGLKVIANDIQYYAYALNKAYLEISRPPSFSRIRGLRKRNVKSVLSLLNQLDGVEGFISENYGPAGGRMYYTAENASKADAIRLQLEEWREEKRLTEREYYYLLCSLIEAVDEVANTASVYGAYLKRFKKTARRDLTLKPLQLIKHVSGCKAWNLNALELVRRIDCDILYLDPPYNQRQYGANYHVLETVAAYDAPRLRGITGMREYHRSDFCRKGTAKRAMRDMIVAARTKHILVSYNDEGVMSLDDIQQLLSLRGTPRIFKTGHTRFKADAGRRYKRDRTTEFVHYVRVVR